jgi:lantibiotic modifying enzyme
MRKTVAHTCIKTERHCHEALTLAAQCGETLKRAAVHTTLGIRFPETGPEGNKFYHSDLYRGAAGIGLALLDLYRATGDKEASGLSREISYDLIESTPPPIPLNPGLYDGHAGIGLFHLAVAETLDDPVPLNAACSIARRISDGEFRGTDILSGAAGTGIFFLHLYNATSDRRYLDYAKATVRYLESSAESHDDSICWAPLIPEWGDNPDRYVPHTGLAHGVAGIAIFLAEMAYEFRDDLSRQLLKGALRWLNGQISRDEDGFSWPVSLTDKKRRYHWCHGSAGIAHTYITLYRKTGREDYLNIARHAVRFSINVLRYSADMEAPYHCHGIAGILESLFDISKLTHGSITGENTARYIQRIMSISGGAGAVPDLPAKQPGLALGTAGILRLLLRIAGKPNIQIIDPARSTFAFKPAHRSGIAIFKKQEHAEHDNLDFLWHDASEELLPRLAEELPDRDLNIIVGPPDRRREHYFFDAFSRLPGNRLFFETLENIRKLSVHLETEYGHIISPGVLNNRFHGPFMREIAGISMCHRNNNHKALHIIKLLTEQYTDMLKLLFRRLSNDIGGRLSRYTEGLIVKMTVISSDPHNNGQRVILIEFEKGRKFVYKSRSMLTEYFLVGSSDAGNHQSVAELLNKWLKPSIKGARLPTHLVIPAGDDYGYAEFIESRLSQAIDLLDQPTGGSDRLRKAASVEATCLRESEEKRFWYSAGLLAGFAMGMGLSDLNQENIVCGTSSSCPDLLLHPVDLEVVFHESDCLRDTMLVDLTAQEQPHLHALGLHRHTGLARELMLCGSSEEQWIMKSVQEGLALIPGMHTSGTLNQKHLVLNHDGSIGYGPYVCQFTRGMIDIWETMGRHGSEIKDYLKDKFTGVPHRVLAKPTALYSRWLRKYRAGFYPVSGASWGADNAIPIEFTSEELHQLRSGDIPYFFEYLGPAENGKSGLRYFPDGPEESSEARSVGNIYRVPENFWDIVDRQTTVEVLARSLADAVSFSAPAGSFDLRDDEAGVRVFREDDNSSIWVVAVLSDRRLTCRVEGEGGVSVWED